MRQRRGSATALPLADNPFRSPSQPTGAEGSSKPASLRMGLCVRFSKQTGISLLVISMVPSVLMNLRKIVWGVAWLKPFRLSARRW